jgi:cytochrome c-type biogenesis protein CcmE
MQNYPMQNYLKFGLLIVAILGALAWLAVGGISDTKTYYKTIKELHQMGDQGKERRIRVGGDIAPNSIKREGRTVEFTLAQVEGQEHYNLKVVYSGIDPLPDTFRDGAQALADGKLSPDGAVFNATKIQAKCASKYEAKPITAKPVARAGV